MASLKKMREIQGRRCLQQWLLPGKTVLMWRLNSQRYHYTFPLSIFCCSNSHICIIFQFLITWIFFSGVFQSIQCTKKLCHFQSYGTALCLIITWQILQYIEFTQAWKRVSISVSWTKVQGTLSQHFLPFLIQLCLCNCICTTEFPLNSRWEEINTKRLFCFLHQICFCFRKTAEPRW